ncbi:glycosyltransferase family 2 protein [Aminobacter sp. HY435]|uniref:glycosyltransferase family 2 protein n=1 Tax=Aminobacter sp. HY435 TaxID=2970917 RepID=UPI0022B98A96|nr:glycosyltransferase [Aminobacter sp. HY435]
MMSVDVVIPCYNYAHFLEQCVASVLSEDVDGLRVIIIDNASTDSSVEVARRLGVADSRVEIVCHDKNIGPQGSFNEGIDLARADYFMILCADDLVSPGALRLGVEALERHPEASLAVGVYRETRSIEEQDKLARNEADWTTTDGPRFIDRCCRSIEHVAAHAFLVRTSIQKQVGYYCSSLPFYDDFQLVLRLARTGSVVELHTPLAVRRIHETSISEPAWGNRLRLLRERQAVFDSFFALDGGQLPGADKMHRLGIKRIAETAFWSAASHVARGKAGTGLELFRYGFSLRPATMLLPPVGHLFRMGGASKRVVAVVSEALGRRAA